MFGIKTVYGWAPGLYDHPKGLALDFMIDDIPNGKAIGDQIVAYLIANAQRLGITYIIWYKQVWSTDRPWWRAYSGVSDHTNHVHSSYKPEGGTGGPAVGIPGASNVGLPNPFDPSKWPIVEKLNSIAEKLLNPDFWKRIGMVGLGLLVLALALVVISRKRAETMIEKSDNGT
jgi:hypothetical protein